MTLIDDVANRVRAAHAQISSPLAHKETSEMTLRQAMTWAERDLYIALDLLDRSEAKPRALELPYLLTPEIVIRLHGHLHLRAGELLNDGEEVLAEQLLKTAAFLAEDMLERGLP